MHNFLPSNLVYSQIWLNLGVNDCQFGYITKQEKKKTGISLAWLIWHPLERPLWRTLWKWPPTKDPLIPKFILVYVGPFRVRKTRRTDPSARTQNPRGHWLKQLWIHKIEPSDSTQRNFSRRINQVFSRPIWSIDLQPCDAT